MDGNIRLEGDISLIKTGIFDFSKDPFGYSAISFQESNISYFENVDLIEKLFVLNENGVVFGEDYKQMYSPAEFMRALQVKGILKNNFTSIFWSGPHKWELRENVVEPCTSL